jgi:putative phosphoesterase
MRVAILSDIHGNLSALQAVLIDVESADVVICCGDLVGYYPDVNEVCAALRNVNAWVIRGNHDAYVLGALDPKPDKALKYQTEWTRQKLSGENSHWLAALPVEIDFVWNGLNVKMRHASPWDEETYLYPDSHKLEEISLSKDDIYVFGHTHHPMLVRAGEGMVLNPGSVGQPRDWNPQASYALIETGVRNIVIRRVHYNVNAYQERLWALGWDEELIKILSRENRGTY